MHGVVSYQAELKQVGQKLHRCKGEANHKNKVRESPKAATVPLSK